MPKPFKNLLAPTATIFVLVPNEIVVNNNAINKTKETTVRNLFLNKTPLIPRPNFLIFFKNAKESRYAFDFLFSLQKEAELPTVCLSVRLMIKSFIFRVNIFYQLSYYFFLSIRLQYILGIIY